MNERMEHGHIIYENVDDDMYEYEDDEHPLTKKRRKEQWMDF